MSISVPIIVLVPLYILAFIGLAYLVQTWSGYRI